uniref:Uncharacterized protein n=1 Tax=Arundo donax TaxID=35708 RepID=A0A0A9BFH1_ARUDO
MSFLCSSIVVSGGLLFKEMEPVICTLPSSFGTDK